MLLYPIVVASLASALIGADFVPYPLVGPDLEPPKHLSISATFQAAISGLQEAITQSLNTSSESFAIFPNNTSFAADVFSIHEDQPYMKYFHSGSDYANASKGASQINDNTIFRLGSISKLYTVFISLIAGGEMHWNNPIFNYVPELARYMESLQSDQPLDYFNFTAMTLGDLAGQTSGLPRDSLPGPEIDASIIANYNLSASMMKPLPTNITDLDCPNPVNAPCNRTAYFGNLFAASPVFPIELQPAYSNIAYGLLALAMENITGLPFEILFNKTLVSKLGLTSTFYHPPEVVPGLNAFIPINASDTASGFTSQINNAIPAGGHFSSLADMRKLSKAILSSSQLSTAATNRWMKPRSFTSNILQSVGDPWEIFTYNSSSGRKVDIYTKGGEWTQYRTLTAMIPIYGVGFNILAGGADHLNAQKILSALIPVHVLEALEQATIDEAASNYNGTYFDGTTDSSITISRPNSQYNVSGPGLLLTEYTFNGTDMLFVLKTFGNSDDPENTQIRLYPTMLNSKNDSTHGWTAIVHHKTTYQNPMDQRPIIGDGAGEEWFNVSPFTLAGKSLYSFRFRIDSNGKAVGVTPVLWNSEYFKA